MLLKEIWGNDYDGPEDYEKQAHLKFPDHFDPSETDAELVTMKEKFFKLADGNEVGMRLVDAVTPGTGKHRMYEIQLISHYRQGQLMWAEFGTSENLDRMFDVACQKVARLTAQSWDELNEKYEEVMEELIDDFAV